MGKRDCRPVPLLAEDAALAARWLRRVAIPALRGMPGTILGGGLFEEDARRLAGLADTLAHKARRKRNGAVFSALIETAEAAAFVRAVGQCRPAWPLLHHAAIVRVADAMGEGGKLKRRGRRSLNADQIAVRVRGDLASEERYRKRLKARIKGEAAWSEWFAQVQARGETLLTSTILPPKI